MVAVDGSNRTTRLRPRCTALPSKEAIMFYLLFISVLFFPSDSTAQVNCARFGNSLSCDGPNLSNRTITEFDKNRGIITDERGNVEPYTIIGGDRDRDRESEARRRSLIYGEDRDRDESRSRSRYEEER